VNVKSNNIVLIKREIMLGEIIISPLLGLKEGFDDGVTVGCEEGSNDGRAVGSTDGYDVGFGDCVGLQL